MRIMITYSCDPKDPCFDWKFDLLLEAKQRTHEFQVCICINTYIDISSKDL